VRPYAGGVSRSRAVWLLGMSWAMIAPSWAADGPAGQGQAAASFPSVASLLEFDIPAQPLEAALFQHGEISLLPTLYPSELTAGLRSVALRGRYSPEDALRRLLDGTGLVAQKMATAHGDVFRLRHGASVPPLAAALPPARHELDGYPARVQAGVLQALCRYPSTAPGSYRALFEVQVDAAGQVAQAALVESTGERGRDAALLAALRRIQVGVPPAAAAPVSYTVTLLPMAAGGSSPCRRQAREAS
jgi:hypothetical protein